MPDSIRRGRRRRARRPRADDRAARGRSPRAQRRPGDQPRPRPAPHEGRGARPRCVPTRSSCSTPTGPRPSSSSWPPTPGGRGRYTSEELPRGMSQMPYDFPGDPELAELIGEEVDGGRFVDDADRRPVPADPLPDDEPAAVPAGRRALGQREHGPDRRDRRLPARRRGHRPGRRAQRAAGRAAGERGDEPHVLEAEGAPGARGVGPGAHPHAGGARGRPRAAGLAGGRRPRPGHRHDARVPPPQARGDVRALPDDGRRRSAGGTASPPGVRYSDYENAIGTGQVHVWFDRPAAGWTSAR